MPSIPFAFTGPEGNRIRGVITDCRLCICFDPYLHDGFPSPHSSNKFIICKGEPNYIPSGEHCAACFELETNFQIMKGKSRNGS